MSDIPSDWKGAGVIEGTVTDARTGAALEGAVVTVVDPLIQFQVGSDGKFRFPPLPVGTRELIVSMDGYVLEKRTIELAPDATVTEAFALERDKGTQKGDEVAQTYEDTIIVTAERESIAPARRTLEREEVRLVAGSWGDPFRAAQNLPGVARPFLGFFGELAVRGSAPEDTRLYVDGHEVPLLYHFGGLKSLINPQSIDDIDFIPGGFGAYYGRATGGVLDAKTRTDVPDRFKFHLRTDLMDTGVFGQIPVGTGAVSIAARRSYVDVFVRGAGAILGEEVVAPRYYDFQLKGDFRLSNGDQLGALFFGTDDALVGNLVTGDEDEDLLRTIFNQLQVHWRRDFDADRTLKLSSAIGMEKGLLSGGITLEPTYHASVRSDYRQHFSADVTFNVGLDVKTRYQDADSLFEDIDGGDPPTTEVDVEDPPPDDPFDVGQPRDFLNEAGAYVEMEWKPDRDWSLVPGVRLDWFETIGQAFADPRMALRYSISPNTTLMTASGLYHQPPRLGLLGIFVFDLGALGIEIPAEQAVHAVFGVEQNLNDLASFDVYTYYKYMEHLVEVTALDLTGILAGEDIITIDGVGRAYGIELMLRLYPTERLFAWASYTLSRAERRADDGSWFPFGYNQTHNLNVVASYQITPTIRVGGRMRFVSGNPYTPFVGSIFDTDTGQYIPISGERLSAKMPPYFQLDLRVDKSWGQRKWTYVLFADIMNVTNRRNPEFPGYNYDYSRVRYQRGLPILPMIGFEAYR